MIKSSLLARDQRARGADDSGAAMITALLAILVTAMFAIVMLGVIISQVMPTQLQQATTRTVFAAEAGVNAVVGPDPQCGRTRQTAPARSMAIASQLPCRTTGTVTSGGTALAYSATIQYYIEDPTTKSDTWRTTN